MGLGSLSLIGCSQPEIQPDTPTTVVSHRYKKQRTIFIPAGKTIVPITYPEEFHLKLKQCGRGQDQFADKEGCVADEIKADKDAYNEYRNGDQITLPIK